MRTIRACAVVPLLCTALVLSACGGISGDRQAEPDDTSTSTSTEPAAPSELVGLWRVSADELDVDTWVQIGSHSSPGNVTVWRQDCVRSGMWRARAGTLLTQVGSWSGTCDGPETPWLDDTTGYALAGAGAVLTDAAGEETARLTIDGAPAPNPDVVDELREQPELTEDQRTALDTAPAPLPDGVEPATEEELLGRWVPPGTYETEPHLELAEDGTWSGSDGCNGIGGRWALAGDGSVLTVAGAQTLIGCDGYNLGGPMAQAAWLVVEGDRLVLYGYEGNVIDEATRE